jgi:hypothetical protein
MDRIGFHYYQDTKHYSQKDLDTWLPELAALRARWLVTEASIESAIPESFLKGLIEAKIQPVLHFRLPFDHTPPLEDLDTLFKVYAKWGIRYVTLFDKPNLRSQWLNTNWTQTDLVERFLDIYLPAAENCLKTGLIPIFPPLEPGGDYWDTAFLKGALEGIKRRGYSYLLDRLVIGAYAYCGNRSINWGSGGPERWPEARPYYKPENSEDQIGFRIFDWYNAIVQSVLVNYLPVFLFGIGTTLDPENNHLHHTETNLTIAKLLYGDSISDTEPIPENIIGSAFWLLSSSKDSPNYSQAWIKPRGDNLPIVEKFSEWVVNDSANKYYSNNNVRSISHYLLLPSYDGMISDTHIDLLRPFIKKYKPTIGFSLKEAAQARKVSVIGGEKSYPDGEIDHLRNSGCIVQTFDENGIDIASL